MLRQLLRDRSLTFVRLKTTGAAISAEVAEPAMTDAIVEIARRSGWISTLNSGRRISIESANPKPADASWVRELFHVSLGKDRASIQADGLRPSCGGNTSLQRSYKDRVHVALRLRDAFQFMHHQLTHPGKTETGEPRVIRFKDLDLFRIVPAPGITFYNDDHFDGRGLWTRSPIPAADMDLVVPETWHGIFQTLYAEVFDESNLDVFKPIA